MTDRHQFLELFDEILSDMRNIAERKNSDYAGREAEDAFANFRAIDILTRGRISMFEGLLVRLTDKLCRLCNVAFGEPMVVDETIEDTLLDNAVYSVIGLCIKRAERRAQKDRPSGKMTEEMAERIAAGVFPADWLRQGPLPPAGQNHE